jgi:lipoprotein signal peptidase
MKSKTKLFLLFAFLVFDDQITKSTFSISVCNKNIAWNIPVPPGIFYFAWAAIIGILAYIFFRSRDYKQKIFLVFIFSGAFSNLIDRIRLGCIVDYIDLKIFPVFNLADVFIAVGTICFMLVIASEARQSRI